MTDAIERIKAMTYKQSDARPGYDLFIETIPYNPERCAGRIELGYRVFEKRGTRLSRQCSRKPGHGLGELFCKQHAAKYQEEPDA